MLCLWVPTSCIFAFKGTGAGFLFSLFCLREFLNLVTLVPLEFQQDSRRKIPKDIFQTRRARRHSRPTPCPRSTRRPAPAPRQVRAMASMSTVRITSQHLQTNQFQGQAVRAVGKLMGMLTMIFP